MNFFLSRKVFCAVDETSLRKPIVRKTNIVAWTIEIDAVSQYRRVMEFIILVVFRGNSSKYTNFEIRNNFLKLRGGIVNDFVNAK